MILYINTIKNNSTEIEIGLQNEAGKWVKKKRTKAEYRQAEKLLPLVEKMFNEMKLSLDNIEAVEVMNQGGSFTSLRIGVVTANALGYALGVPVRGVKEIDGRTKDKIGKGEIRESDKAGSDDKMADAVKSVKLTGEEKKKDKSVKAKKFNIVKAEYEREPNITLKKG